MALEGSGPCKTAFKTACKKLTGTNVCSKNHIHIGILLCLWLQHPDGLPPIVTNFYLRQKISSKRMRDKAIDKNCKIETAGRFLENQWVKSLSFFLGHRTSGLKSATSGIKFGHSGCEPESPHHSERMLALQTYPDHGTCHQVGFEKGQHNVRWYDLFLFCLPCVWTTLNSVWCYFSESTGMKATHSDMGLKSSWVNKRWDTVNHFENFSMALVEYQ